MCRAFYSRWHYFIENKAFGVMKPGHTFTIEPMISQGTCYIIVRLFKHLGNYCYKSRVLISKVLVYSYTPQFSMVDVCVGLSFFFPFENLFICLFLCNSLGLFVYFSNKLMQLKGEKFSNKHCSVNYLYELHSKV